METLGHGERATEIDRWYREHGAALLLFGIALTGDRGRAQDAVHQVFLRLLERPEKGPTAEVRIYLFSAVRNAIISDVRQRSRIVDLDSDGGPWFEAPSHDYVEELTVRRALESLTEDQREVMVLHVWGGLTFSEAAEVLQLNANTVAARYRYGLKKMQGMLAPPAKKAW